MNRDNFLKNMSLLVNRSLNQCSKLFSLCDESEELYMKLEATIKERNDFYFVPGDRETIDNYLTTT